MVVRLALSVDQCCGLSTSCCALFATPPLTLTCQLCGTEQCQLLVCYLLSACCCLLICGGFCFTELCE